jgi:hypothetical protein
MAAENPALLNSKSVRMLQINQSILPNGISIGMVIMLSIQNMEFLHQR